MYIATAIKKHLAMLPTDRCSDVLFSPHEHSTVLSGASHWHDANDCGAEMHRLHTSMPTLSRERSQLSKASTAESMIPQRRESSQPVDGASATNAREMRKHAWDDFLLEARLRHVRPAFQEKEDSDFVAEMCDRVDDAAVFGLFTNRCVPSALGV